MGLAFFVCHIFYGDVGLGVFGGGGGMEKWWVRYEVCDKWRKMEWFSSSVFFCVYRSEAQRVRPSVVRHNL